MIYVIASTKEQAKLGMSILNIPKSEYVYTHSAYQLFGIDKGSQIIECIPSLFNIFTEQHSTLYTTVWMLEETKRIHRAWILT